VQVGNPQHVDHWRDEYDYRSEYFKRKPGLFGAVWFCSQCWKPLIGKDKVEVDHGFPPSFFAKKKRNRHGQIVKNNSVLAKAMNRPFNLVACCKECNRGKSDKIGVVTVKAGIAQVIETVMFSAQRAVVVGTGLALKLSYFVISNGLKLLAKPLIAKNPWHVKALVVAAYVGFGIYLFTRL
jgi:hypothetical protein